jgi:hypothetical protein
MPGTDQVKTGTYIRMSRWSQSAACIVASLFLLGFFIHAIGMWTGVILGVWFVGTQKLGRGFLWMAAFSLLPSILATWHVLSSAGLRHGASQLPEFRGPFIAQFVGLTALAVLLGVLPFTFHRLISPRLPGIFSTLPLALAAVALPALVLEVDPAFHVGPDSGNGLLTFFICWFAAVMVWMWNLERGRQPVARCAFQSRDPATKLEWPWSFCPHMPWRSFDAQRLGSISPGETTDMVRPSADRRVAAQPLHRRLLACGERTAS